MERDCNNLRLPSFWYGQKFKISIDLFGLEETFKCSGYLLHLADAQQKRCNGADAGCCTEATPCGEMEGDCDRNEDCKGHFVTKDFKLFFLNQIVLSKVRGLCYCCTAFILFRMASLAPTRVNQLTPENYDIATYKPSINFTTLTAI